MIPRIRLPARPSALWVPAVIVTVLLAHGGCLGSTFYLDDWTQIVDCDAVDQGAWWSASGRALTYLTYYLTYRVAGMSPVAFHAGNLLLHAAAALALLGFTRDFLTVAAGLPVERARRIGGWSAVLFAAHPLCSEMPNYARARDIGLVSLFALLAAWAVVRWRCEGGWRWVAAALGAVAAATFSKEVGLPVAAGTVAVVLFGSRRRGAGGVPPVGDRRRLLRLAGLLGGAVLLLLGIGYANGLGFSFSAVLSGSFGGTRLGWHTITQARVFWQYLARVAWPAHLCSDHQIAWTVTTADVAAWVAVAAQTAVVGAAAAALCQRRPAVRAAGTLAAVALLDIMHRLANVSSELMVEYRMYPAMLPICALLAWSFDEARRLAEARWTLPPALTRAVLGGIVAAWVAVSARRTLDWRSTETLAANILAQYPCNARAWQELQEADLRARRWQAVIARQEDIRRAFDGAVAFDAAHVSRKYDLDEMTLVRVVSEGNTALGVARLGRRAEAFARLTWIHTVMDASVTYPFLWSMYYYSSATVHDAVGEHQDALDDLRTSVELYPYQPYTKRQLRRYQAGEPLQ